MDNLDRYFNHSNLISTQFSPWQCLKYFWGVNVQIYLCHAQKIKLQLILVFLKRTVQFIFKLYVVIRAPISVAARSKAWVCGLLLAAITGSIPAGGMDVCLM
jgi:hypothetical protein